MGLDNIHCMTNILPGTKLRVELGGWEGNSYYAEYSQFIVGDSSTNYRMNVSGYSGNAGDQLSYHNGQMFSTYDQDHDSHMHSGSNNYCAVLYRGGLWYKTAIRSILMVNTSLEELVMQKKSHGLMPNMELTDTTHSNLLK